MADSKPKKPKGWVKRNREFLNVPKSGCMAGVAWTVGLEYWNKWDNDGERKLEGFEAHATGEININDEGQRQYVERKADLRPLRTMRRELDKFEDALLEAFTEAESYNEEGRNKK